MGLICWWWLIALLLAVTTTFYSILETQLLIFCHWSDCTLFKIFKYSGLSVLVFGRSLGRWDSCVSAYAPVHVPLFMQSEVAPTRMTESTPPRGMLCSVDEDTLFWCKRRGFKPLCVKERNGIDLSCSQCMPCLLVCSVKEDSLWQGCESNLFVLIFVFSKYLSMHFSSGKHTHFYQVKVK